MTFHSAVAKIGFYVLIKKVGFGNILMMARIFFYFIQTLGVGLIFFAHPVLVICSLFSRPIRERLKFELSTQVEEGEFDAIFEVASEGELEQVIPVLESYIYRNKRVLLFYASKSVSKKIEELELKHTESSMLEVCVLPLLSFFGTSTYFSRSMSRLRATDFYFCRYDFYPHLLLLSKLNSKRVILLSATLINKPLFSDQIQAKKSFPYSSFRELALVFRRFYWRQLISHFDSIYFASSAEEKRFKKLCGELYHLKQFRTFDFRLVRIIHRLEMSNDNLKIKWPVSHLFIEMLQTGAGISDRVLLFGSAWIEDIKCLPSNWDFAANLTIIAPHLLNKDYIDDFTKDISKHFENGKKSDVPIYIWKSNMDLKQANEIIAAHLERPGPHLILTPGILCELYQFTPNVFVGGGFGRSIHSVIEPFVSGAMIFCGPKIHRSTEYEFIKSYDSSKVIKISKPSDFYPLFKKFSNAGVREHIFVQDREKLLKMFHNLVEEIHDGQVEVESSEDSLYDK